jgi:CheY-like chemotaxis protein
MKRSSVLIVEDDKWLAEQYARVLKLAGYKTTVSLHALAAIEVIDDIHPDAIVLDVLLAGSTAFALIHELQTYEDTGKIPIILCTHLASELSLENLKPYGVKRIIDKSVMVPDDLVSAVKSVLL